MEHYQQIEGRPSIEDIWNNVNVSTVMVLSLFDKLMRGDSHRIGDLPTIYHLLQLVYAHGFIQSFMYNPDTNVQNTIHMLFSTRELNAQTGNWTKQFSFLEFLLNSSFFYRTEPYLDRILISFKIPEEYSADLVKIESSKYTQISDTYKNLLYIGDSELLLPTATETYGDYIVSYNLPYHIACGDPRLTNSIIKELELDEQQQKTLLESGAVFNAFNSTKETFYYDV